MIVFFKHLELGQQPSIREWNRLTAMVTALRRASNVLYFDDSRGIHIRQMPAPLPAMIHLAFSENVAAANTDAFDCFLDTDTTGDSISVIPTVNTTVSALSLAAPRLYDGTPIAVWKDTNDIWRTVVTFEKAGPC